MIDVDSRRDELLTLRERLTTAAAAVQQVVGDDECSGRRVRRGQAGHHPVLQQVGARHHAQQVAVGVQHRVRLMLAAGAAHIDAYYYCPHHPDGKVPGLGVVCECRKPARGLVDRAVQEFGIDPERSFVIGDRWVDVRLARTSGAKAVLVRTGYGDVEERMPPEGVTADAVVDNLVAASSWILHTL